MLLQMEGALGPASWVVNLFWQQSWRYRLFFFSSGSSSNIFRFQCWLCTVLWDKAPSAARGSTSPRDVRGVCLLLVSQGFWTMINIMGRFPPLAWTCAPTSQLSWIFVGDLQRLLADPAWAPEKTGGGQLAHPMHWRAENLMQTICVFCYRKMQS